jgi:hypothetical protein
MLGTGYCNFEADCGCCGLAKETDEGKTLQLLAVVATLPGTGQFRKFVELAKKNYTTICVWEIWNEDLTAALVRYGFVSHSQDEDGEHLEGMKWSALTPLQGELERSTHDE